MGYSLRVVSLVVFSFFSLLTINNVQADQCIDNPSLPICPYTNLNPDVLIDTLTTLTDSSPIADLINLSAMYGFGQTYEGNDIYAVRITSRNSDDNTTPDPLDENDITKIDVVLDSLQHGNEPMTLEVTLDIIQYLTSEYSNPNATNVHSWVNNLEIWIIPMVNPDGAHFAYKTNYWWRKNRQPFRPLNDGSGMCTACSPGENCNGAYAGIDLNRNYAFSWDSCDAVSIAPDCSDQEYRGSSALSTIETRTIDRLIERERPLFYLSYHSGLADPRNPPDKTRKAIFYPYGCSLLENSEPELFTFLGGELRNAIDPNGDLDYRLHQVKEVVSASGSSIAHAYGKYGVSSFAVEIHPFPPVYDFPQRDTLVTEQRPLWQALLDRAVNGPTVRMSIDAMTAYSESNGMIRPLAMENIRSTVKDTSEPAERPNNEPDRSTDYEGDYEKPLVQGFTETTVDIHSEGFDSLYALQLSAIVSPELVELDAESCSNYYFEFTDCTNPVDAHENIRYYTSWRNRASYEGKNIRIPVQFHLIRRDDGTTNIDLTGIETELDLAISEINQIYSASNGIGNINTQIQFTKEATSFIDNSQYYEDAQFFLAKSREMTRQHNTTGAINIYFIPQEITDLDADGYGTQPYMCSQLIFMKGIERDVDGNLVIVESKKIAHEIGHFLHLHHGDGTPVPAGTTCRDSDDLICDETFNTLMGSRRIEKFSSEQAARSICSIAQLRPDFDPDGDQIPSHSDACPLDADQNCQDPLITDFWLDTQSTIPLVHLYGFNFPSDSTDIQITVDGQPVQANASSTTSLVFIKPSFSGSGTIRLTTPFGSTTAPRNMSMPASGLSIAGFWREPETLSILHIVGSGFSSITSSDQIRIDGVPVTGWHMYDDTHIMALVPDINSAYYPETYLTGQISITTPLGSTISTHDLILEE